MPKRILHLAATALLLVLLTSGAVAGGDSPLTDADRQAFAWFDGIGLPSCKGKPYVRIRWVTAGAKPETLARADLWQVDGFLVAEEEGVMTLLDGDLWPRKIGREASPGWTGEVIDLELAEVARAATTRLRALVSDPGAVEPVDVLFRRVRLRFGEEALALALARHCAENGLEQAAHDLLDAARALPADPADAPAAPLEAIVAPQIAESVIWRIVRDFSDPSISRSTLLERFRGWRRSFPESAYVERADEAIRVLEGMVADEEAESPLSDEELAALPPAERARELVRRLRDQPGDVFMSRSGRVSIDIRDRKAPAAALLELGEAAVPALIEGLTDDRFTRAVLFIWDTTFERQVVARVGDIARVALEQIVGEVSWDVPLDTPSMFQHAGTAAELQAWWRERMAPSEDFVERLVELSEAADAAEGRELASAFPDRGSGPLPGATDAVWGTKSFVAAIPELEEDEARTLLGLLLEHAPMPRTRALAAWALLDLGADDVVTLVVRVWVTMSDAQRADPEQGGAVISFLAACGEEAGIRALAADLQERPAPVRELVVLAFGGGGLGAVRGFAADRPDGVRERWPEDEPTLTAIEALLTSRLEDLEEDPLGLIPRQEPLCDMVPSYDCGRRIADAVVRVLNRHWPSVYPARDEPVREDTTWEALRTTFLETWNGRRKTDRSE